MRLYLVFISCLFLSALASPPITSPDPDLTPSSYCTPSDPDFTEYRYNERIPWCRRNVAQATKVEVYHMYGLEPDRDYTIDHLIPLSLGGSNHIDNLWPQHKSVYSGNLEYQMYLKLRNGEITRQEAVDYVLAFKFEELFGY
jgi:hypothetical protein